MARCRIHRDRETEAACAHCGFPYCESCLAEFLGQVHCGNCRDARLTLMQRGAPAPGYTSLARWSVWTALGALAGVVILTLGAAILPRMFPHSAPLRLTVALAGLGLAAIGMVIGAGAAVLTVLQGRTRVRPPSLPRRRQGGPGAEHPGGLSGAANAERPAAESQPP